MRQGGVGAPTARLCRVPGPVALVGAGEFLPAMAEFDLELLAATGRPRPRVAILPTASYPDGEEVFTRWASMGVAHFGELGAEVEPVLVRDREDADDAATRRRSARPTSSTCPAASPATCCGSSTGAPSVDALIDAHDRGAVLAGCSAGAMVLAGHAFDFRAAMLPWPLRWRPGLGFAPGTSVVPHYDAWPEPMSALVALQAPRGSVVLGIDEETAVIGRDGVVAGPRRVAGHGLARPAPRAAPRRRDLPGLKRANRRP